MISYDVIIAISNFSLFTFLGLFIASSKSKKRLKNNFGILLSSFLMFISNSFLYFEVKCVISNKPSAILSFITYSTLFWAIILLMYCIRKLYLESSTLNIRVFVAQGFLVGIIFSGYAMFEVSYLIRSLTFGAIMVFPVVSLEYFLVNNNLQVFKNVFFYQLSLIAIIFSFKLLNIIIFEPNAYFDTVSKVDTIFTMHIIVIFITIFTSYLFEKQHILNSNLDTKTSILESTLLKVKSISETDQLTELSNRYKVNEYLKILQDRNKIFSEEFSIIMCDINDFKSINDSYGHNIGDEVLRFASTSLLNLLREKDIVGRWGGDEFIILLPETSNIFVSSIKSKIRKYFSSNSCPSIKKNITLSMGSTTFDINSSIDELIHEADLKMYKNKESLKSK